MRREGYRPTSNSRGAEINGSLAPSLQARGNSSRGAGYRSSTSSRPSFLPSLLPRAIFQHSSLLASPFSSVSALIDSTFSARTFRAEDTPVVFRTDTRARPPVHVTRRIAAQAGGKRQVRLSRKRACNTPKCHSRPYARTGASRSSTVNDQPCTRVVYARNCLYEHVRKSIRQAITNLKQLVVSNPIKNTIY